MTGKELSTEQAEAVRRLLAEARHDEPMPDAVGRRLDHVIAGLAADRAGTDPEEPREATVIPLRRRRWPRVLVAAAAVSAIGLGVTQVVSGVGGSGDDSGAADGDTALLDERAPRATAEDDGALAPGPADAPNAPPADAGDLTDAGRDARLPSDWRAYLRNDGVSASALSELTTALGSAKFGALQPLDRRGLPKSLQRLARAVTPVPAAEAYAGDLLVVDETAYDAGIAPRACGPIYTVVGGKATYATYHRKLALVLFHPEINGAQLVELYVCSGRTPRRSVERVTLWDGE